MMYELLYIIPTRFTDAEVAEIQTKTNGLIEKAGGKIIKEENLGRIRLAYPIKQNHHGVYILSYLEGEGAMVSELDKQLRLSNEVLRHMIVELPKGLPERSFVLESYVAPLSEEDEENRRSSKRPISVDTPKFVAPIVEVEPVVREEKPLSMEELDKKLDEILDADISDKV
jgi:small subunit ribosomal protein S6